MTLILHVPDLLIICDDTNKHLEGIASNAIVIAWIKCDITTTVLLI